MGIFALLLLSQLCGMDRHWQTEWHVLAFCTPETKLLFGVCSDLQSNGCCESMTGNNVSFMHNQHHSHMLYIYYCHLAKELTTYAFVEYQVLIERTKMHLR